MLTRFLACKQRTVGHLRARPVSACHVITVCSFLGCTIIAGSPFRKAAARSRLCCLLYLVHQEVTRPDKELEPPYTIPFLVRFSSGRQEARGEGERGDQAAELLEGGAVTPAPLGSNFSGGSWCSFLGWEGCGGFRSLRLLLPTSLPRVRAALLHDDLAFLLQPYFLVLEKKGSNPRAHTNHKNCSLHTVTLGHMRQIPASSF